MLWGIPGALIGALLALRLGGWLLLVLGLVALALGVVLLRRGRTVYALPLLLGLLLLRGAALPQVNVVPGLYEVTGAVMDAPEQKRGETTVILDRVTLDGRRVPGALTLTVPFRADLAYGDALALQARVTSDDRGAVQSLKTVLYVAQGAGEIIVRQGRADPLYGLALRWREKLGASADALFGENGGVARGMLFGDRDDVHYLTFLAFRRSGLLHLLTVSGLHVGVVCGAALRLIRGRRKWLRFLLSVLLLFLFCLLTGLSPSSLRAAIMLLAVWFSHLLDRQDDPISVIGCAWTLLLLINPALLMASVPLLSVTGGEVSWVGMFLSLLALPAAPLFLIPGWIAVLLYPLLPAAAQIVALLPKGVLYYLFTLAELVPVAGLTLPPCNGTALLLWFAGMLFVSDYFLPNRTKPAFLGWGLMAAGALVWFLV